MSDPRKGPFPPMWRLLLVKWLGIFPPLLVISYALGWLTGRFLPTDWALVNDDGSLDLWLKLFIETLILVPSLNLFITPWLDDAFEDFLYTDAQQAQMREDPEA